MSIVGQNREEIARDTGALQGLADKRERYARTYSTIRWALRIPGLLMTSAGTGSYLAEQVGDVDVADSKQLVGFTLGALLTGLSRYTGERSDIANRERLTFQLMADRRTNAHGDDMSIDEYREGYDSIRFNDGFRSHTNGSPIFLGGQNRPDIKAEGSESRKVVMETIGDARYGIYPDRITLNTTQDQVM